MEASENVPSSSAPFAARWRTPSAYRICDRLTEGMVYFMVLFAPWAFGTTERWSNWTMNAAAYVLGALLLLKWIIRWRTSHRPVRWGEELEGGDSADPAEAGQGGRIDAPSRDPFSGWLTAALATLTILLLAYCLVSALNARSTFYYRQRAFEPHDYIAWLPHSLDSYASWQAFWMYLGLAFVFWATRDWLLGKSSRECRAPANGGGETRARSALRPRNSGLPLPARLRRLLWVLCLNGAALGLEGILQRLSGTDELLWWRQPEINRSNDVQFGPFAYRSNAAQYLNLLWPVCLGFWWSLRHECRGAGEVRGRVGGAPHMLLLPCAVIMTAAPIISTSRGGAIVAATGLLAAMVLLLVANRRGRPAVRLGIVGLGVASLALAGYLGWTQLEARLRTTFTDDLSGRRELYQNARQIARDYPIFGTGPGTFAWVYHLYLSRPDATWEAYAHNDWLETRLTFGWVGFILAVGMLVLVLARGFAGGGIRVWWVMLAMLWLAMAGCLAHAVFDFPFQVYSTLGLFLQLCCIAFCLSRR